MCEVLVFQSFLYGMVSGSLGSSADTHASSERSTVNPRPYLAPPTGVNDYCKESKRIANSPHHEPRETDRKSTDNSGVTSSKRNAQREKKEKMAPPVFV